MNVMKMIAIVQQITFCLVEWVRITKFNRMYLPTNELCIFFFTLAAYEQIILHFSVGNVLTFCESL
jgi:hypothetical protein